MHVRGFIDEHLVDVLFKTVWKEGSATGKRCVSRLSRARGEGLMAFKPKVEAEGCIVRSEAEEE